MDGKWDARFMDLAETVAQWSKDPSTKVGCVLANEQRQVVGLGFNGFPRGVNDFPDRYLDRPTKYLMVQHAEANAVLQAAAPVKGATAYVTHHPCSSCMGVLIQAGIKRVVTTKPGALLGQRFLESFHAAYVMAVEAGVWFDVRGEE